MTGKPQNGRRRALTPTEMQRRWRAKKKRLATGKVKREKREAMMAAMAARTAAVQRQLGAMRAIYNVVVIDPPWDFEVRNRLTGLDRSESNHYPTMSLEQIAALKIPAAPDCVLALWATNPMMQHAMRLLEHWQFEYVTLITWNKRTKDMAKVRRVLGYVARGVTEHLIICKRGSPPWAIPGEQWDTAFDAPVTEHSVKPDAPYAFLESQFGRVPKLDMFARARREGWDCWGAEAP
jgi:N6-adenosine-specific RNA methylase IME4